MTCQLFAGISVSDYPVALDWYERLLGQPPSFSPNDVEWVWDINESGWVYVEHRPQHAGHALVAIFVDDIEALAASMVLIDFHEFSSSGFSFTASRYSARALASMLAFS